MRDTPSFHKINYSIRTNKNIERKLVFDTLLRLKQPFSLECHRYIGFGSMWFVDFVLAHRMLGIRSMWSIERNDNADRADYNRPYDCVHIKPGLCAGVLEGMSDAEWSVPSIAWLDYDGIFDSDVRTDCERYLNKTAAGSALIVSVNAERRSYRPTGNPQEGRPSIDTLRELLGNAVPADALPLGRRDVDPDEFPGLLMQSISNFMTSTVHSSGRQSDGYLDRFVPLFLLQHRDAAQMVTVGGTVVSWRQMATLESALGRAAGALQSGDAAIRDVLDLIPVTMKEKLALDRLLPCADEQFAERFSASGIKLKLEQAAKYRRLYTHFPVFAELQP